MLITNATACAIASLCSALKVGSEPRCNRRALWVHSLIGHVPRAVPRCTMARLARVVLPAVAHRVTQRGNRRLPVFFGDEDRRLYLLLLRAGLARADVACLAWCLMDNHVHLILMPRTADGLRAGLAEAHRRYTRYVNFREGWRGHLFQARFASYPMAPAHLLAAIRYVENNPVAAGLVPRAVDWRWSSARSHAEGQLVAEDALTDLPALGLQVCNWRAMLRHGWEAGDLLLGHRAADRLNRRRSDTAGDNVAGFQPPAVALQQ
ncbi:MAG: transposase [Sandaracinobacteroides sp.]